jgi:hypothetical protein
VTKRSAKARELTRLATQPNLRDEDVLEESPSLTRQNFRTELRHVLFALPSLGSSNHPFGEMSVRISNPLLHPIRRSLNHSPKHFAPGRSNATVRRLLGVSPYLRTRLLAALILGALRRLVLLAQPHAPTHPPPYALLVPVEVVGRHCCQGQASGDV